MEDSKTGPEELERACDKFCDREVACHPELDVPLCLATCNSEREEGDECARAAAGYYECRADKECESMEPCSEAELNEQCVH